MCRNLFSEPSALLSIGRFQLVRTLGRGGMGSVYEAIDPQQTQRVALKTLLGESPSHLYRLKREFRSLAGLEHPNLVGLHQLFIDEHAAYFTMELVEGCDFLSFVRQGAAPSERLQDESRLRQALVQLCAGVRVLHEAGKLHHDLKPGNVLVTPAGRVVLLDFGLVRDVSSVEATTAGTAAYMAPEQFRGAACEASDWFSVGRMLQEALYGLRRPTGALSASSDLERLAEALTQPDQAQRAGFVEICRVLGAGSGVFPVPSNAPREWPFVGRERELHALGQAFAQSRTEGVALVLRGESGIGKSALARQFVKRVAEPAGALVLWGGCYEREALPYKALDGVIDGLAQELSRAAAPDAMGAAIPGAAQLLQLFPVLGRVAWLRRLAHEAPTLPLWELRQRAFAALKALLRLAAAGRPLLICIDDLHGSDADSGRLLGALLCTEDPVPLLLLGTELAGASRPNPAIEELDYMARFAPTPHRFVRLELGPLARVDVQRLMDHADAGASSPVLAPLTDEMPGNPLFLRELARWRAEQQDEADSMLPRSLEVLLEARLRKLSPHGRALLELLAAARLPLPATVIERAVGAEFDPREAVHTLQAQRLARRLRTGHGDTYATAPAQLGGVVLQGLSDSQRSALHMRLARALEQEPNQHCSALVDQYLGAGLPREASRAALRGARASLACLAFSRAARLFEQALQLGDFSASERAQLERELAGALEEAGRGLEAGEAYARAAELCGEPRASAQDLQRAALHLMYNGHYARGAALARAGYRRLGIPWPRGPVAMACASAARLLASPMRALGLRARGASPELRRARAEFCAVVGRGMALSHPARAIYNAFVCFDEAEQLSDPVWDARVMGGRGIMRCASVNRRVARSGLVALQAAVRAADQLGDRSALAELLCQLAGAHFVCGEPRAAFHVSQRALTLFSLLPRNPMDLHAAIGLHACVLVELGEMQAARRSLGSFAEEARVHGDLSLCSWIHASPARLLGLLASHERASAEALIALLARMHQAHPGCRLTAWEYAASRLEVALYWTTGRQSLQLMERERRHLFGIGYGAFTRKVRLMRARVRLAAAAELPPGRERTALVRAALRDAPVLIPDGPLYIGLSSLLVASGQLLLQRPEAALASLDQAIVWSDRAEAKLVAATARYGQGLLLGGESGRQLQAAARAQFTAEGVVDPERWIGWSAPGFRVALGAVP